MGLKIAPIVMVYPIARKVNRQKLSLGIFRNILTKPLLKDEIVIRWVYRVYVRLEIHSSVNISPVSMTFP